jgi:hypothetical protein
MSHQFSTQSAMLAQSNATGMGRQIESELPLSRDEIIVLLTDDTV